MPDGETGMDDRKEIQNTAELASLVERLEERFRDMRGSGGLDVQSVQVVADSLTRFQLLLNELERIEVHGNGVTREAAGRFAELESRIRSLRRELYDGLRKEPTDPARAG